MIKNIKMITALVAATGLMAGSAFADDKQDLRAWAQDAGKEITSAMSYPKIAMRSGITGTTTHIVTINKDGEVIGYERGDGRSKAVLNSASRRALKRVDFPALPASFDHDNLTFRLALDYKEYVDPTRQAFIDAKNRRKGSVTGSRIAILSVSDDVTK